LTRWKPIAVAGTFIVVAAQAGFWLAACLTVALIVLVPGPRRRAERALWEHRHVFGAAIALLFVLYVLEQVAGAFGFWAWLVVVLATVAHPRTRGLAATCFGADARWTSTGLR
jgi:hypothetical protein